MRLYDLSEQYNMLLEMIEEDAGNEQLAEMLDGLEGKIEEKVENTVLVMKSVEAEAKVLKEEEDRIKKRRMSLENKIAYLKENIENGMKSLGIEKVKGKLHTVSLQVNPPKVVVQDEFYIPEQYFFTPEPVRQLKKKDIIEAWKNGEGVPGVAVVQEKTLRVR